MNCDFLFIGIYQCQFLSPEDAVEYLQSLQDEEEANLYDQDHTSLTIIPPPDAASDYEGDDDVIMVPTTDKPTDIANTLQQKLCYQGRMINQLTTMNQTCSPTLKKNKIKSKFPQYSQTPETMSHNGVQDIKQALGRKSVSDIFISMTNYILDKILEQSLLWSTTKSAYIHVF